MLGVAWEVGVIAVATVIIWRGSIWLESSGNVLSAYYGLPPVVQGAIVAAAGSSFPELASVVIAAIRYDSLELGVAGIIGSALFNVLVIPAISGLSQSSNLDATRDLVYKEGQFYLLSTVSLLAMFAMAGIYHPTGQDPLTVDLKRWLAVPLLALYGLYVFIQYQDTSDHDAAEPPSISVRKQWTLLVVGLALIFVGVEFLVGAAEELGQIFETDDFLWGLIVIAIGTSLPDAIISIKAAGEDRDEVSLANVFGSNVFDILVAVPIGVLLATAVEINFDIAAPMTGFLIACTAVVLIVSRTQFEITDREAWLLLAIYVGFVIWMILESIGILAFVR